MTPYYQDEAVTLYHGDCLEVMQSIPDKSVDAIIADPPYGTTACKWDSVIPFEPMWEQLKRIAKDKAAIVLFGSEPFSSHLRMSNIKDFKYDWIIKKSRVTGHLSAYKRPMTRHEIVSVFCAKRYFPQIVDKEKRNVRPYSKTYSNIYHNQTEKVNQKDVRKIPLNKTLPSTIIESIGTQDNLHPTQKPVDLMEYLIKTYTQEGETVLDFTMGSGTTGVACVNTSRKFIGIELDAGYCEIGVNRIKQAQSMPRLEGI